MSVVDVESRIPAKHPIREVKKMVDSILQEMEPTFSKMYKRLGRPSIPPERLLGAKVLMALYTVRSERQFCERLRYDLLFQWFLDMNPDEEAFDASSFSQNQKRFLEHQVAESFFARVVQLANTQGWVSEEHFSVDGTLIEAWASLKSFRPKEDEKENTDDPGGRNGWVDFKDQKRSNETHESSTDPEARLMRKGNGQPAKLSFGAHAVMENRNGLCVAVTVTKACGEGCTEDEVALRQLHELKTAGMNPQTVGADKGYHTHNFVDTCNAREVDPHVAVAEGRFTDGIDCQSEAYKISRKIRMRIEELFGWVKTTGGFRKSRYVGVQRNNLCALFVFASANLIRMAKLSQAPPGIA